jgi:hypothetical protein
VGHESLADASSLGEASDVLWKSVRNFIGSFWTLFGRASARQMAEERRAKVIILVVLSHVYLLFLICSSGCVGITEGQEGFL